MTRRAGTVRSVVSMLLSCHTTIVEARISISESIPNAPSATDRAAIAVIASTMTPITFQPSVAYSSAKPRRSSTRAVGEARGTGPLSGEELFGEQHEPEGREPDAGELVSALA